MRILILNDLNTGGAAVACKRTVAVLSQYGKCETRLLTGYPSESNDAESISGNFPGCRFLFRYSLTKRVSDLLRRHLLRLRSRSILREYKPDIVHIHNIHDAPAWGLFLIEEALSAAPVVWTLHDMWPLTNGICYLPPSDVRTDGPIRDASSEKRADTEPRYRKLKKLIDLNRKRLHFVSPSEWLATEARLRGIHQDSVSIIRNTLDLNTYRPAENVDPKLSREGQYIPIAVTCAVDLSEWRKGGLLLKEALEQLDRPLRVHVIGNKSIVVDNPNVTITYAGYIDDESQLAEIIKSADIFIHPAVIDNYPNVVLESISCGIPVVAFPTGGVPELVIPGKTGWLAEHITAVSMAEAVLRAMGQYSDLDYKTSCRDFAEERFGARRHAESLMELYQMLIHPSEGSRS